MTLDQLRKQLAAYVTWTDEASDLIAEALDLLADANAFEVREMEKVSADDCNSYDRQHRLNMRDVI